jgi:D-amino-acid dehydrogenase
VPSGREPAYDPLDAIDAKDMKIVVCGAGVIGVTTAYYLATMGHEVVVVDRLPHPGMDTSFANAGQVSWGYASPWAAPGIPLKALRWMFERHAPLIIRPRIDPALWKWLIRMLRHCNEEDYARSKTHMVRLATFSAACLRQLRDELGLHYDEGTRGTLQIFRSQKAMDAAAADSAVLTRLGIPHAFLSRAGCVEKEPGLWLTKDKIVGGLHLPGDETGDCHLFTQELARRAARCGVTFHLDTAIQGFEVAGDRVTQLATDLGPLSADAFVVALGSHSPRLLRPLGINIPVYPVKGYSATLPVGDRNLAPRSTLMDEAYKVAVTRLGDRVRVAGMAELAGYDLKLRRRPCDTLAHVVRDLFPAGADRTRVQFWTGLRAMTPDGPPILGAARYGNLFLNTGHGTLGWTMACGSGRVVAELVSGMAPSIDLVGLTIARYAR